MASSSYAVRAQQSLPQEFAEAEGVMGTVYDVITEGQVLSLGQEAGLGAHQPAALRGVVLRRGSLEVRGTRARYTRHRPFNSTKWKTSMMDN